MSSLFIFQTRLLPLRDSPSVRTQVRLPLSFWSAVMTWRKNASKLILENVVAALNTGPLPKPVLSVVNMRQCNKKCRSYHVAWGPPTWKLSRSNFVTCGATRATPLGNAMGSSGFLTTAIDLLLACESSVSLTSCFWGGFWFWRKFTLTLATQGWLL